MLVPTQKQGRTRNGHSLQTHCKNGHEFNEVNTYISPTSRKRSCRICTSQRVSQRWYSDLDTSRTKAREHMRQWRDANRPRDRKNWTELRKSKKAWLIEYKLASGGCKECGESDPVCLDFHHRNPEQKELTISLAIARASLERIQMEVAKCDILCANCHRKLHARNTDI